MIELHEYILKRCLHYYHSNLGINRFVSQAICIGGESRCTSHHGFGVRIEIKAIFTSELTKLVLQNSSLKSKENFLRNCF